MLKPAAILALFFITSSFLILPSSEEGPGWKQLSTVNGDLPKPGPGKQQTASLILDIDLDGREDFVIAERTKAPSVHWYRNLTSGWEKYVLDTSQLSIEAGGDFHDIDGDGDLDISFGGDASSNKVWWWENPYPNFNPVIPWVRREIKNSGPTKHHDQIFGDFDGDGATELVFWNQGANTLFMAEIPLDKNTEPWSYVPIYTYASADHEGLAKTDIDDDGLVDIVGGGRWYKHEDGAVFTPHLIDRAQNFSRAAAGQLIPGGWAEVVFVVGDGSGRLIWYEWDGERWVGHDPLGFDVDHGHSLEIADIDSDGYKDIFCSEMRLNGGNSDAYTWVIYGDGNGSFAASVVTEGFGNHESKLGDLDDDGDIDILSKPYNWDTPRIDIWLNNEGWPLNQWQRHVIDEKKPWKSVFITAADLNGDGWRDIITGGWWYQNPGLSTDQWYRHEIGAPLSNMAAVHDFDGDGDSDVLGTQGKGASANAQFLWGRNDGYGHFTIMDNIAVGNGDFLQGVAVARYQRGVPLQVALSWHSGGNGVQMISLPLNPIVEMWSWEQATSISQDEDLSVGDVDRDGDLDLLLGTIWLRNDSGLWSELVIFPAQESPDRNRLADVNGDGRLDAIVGFEAISRTGKLVWYEQGEDLASVWSEHLISQLVGPMSLDARDMDSDGDIDVVVGEHNLSDPSNAGLYVFENLDGFGGEWDRHTVYVGDEHHDGAHLVDIDEDGDLDIISIGWGHSNVILYENKALDPVNTPWVFEDVPLSHWAYRYVGALHEEGYIAGCSADPPRYCPDATMVRAESAVFVERGIHGAGFLPIQPVDQVFADVEIGEWYAKWAAALWEDGYTSGCGTDPLIFCPIQQHTRVEGAVFFLRMLHGRDFAPPPAEGFFADMSPDWWGTKWAEAAYRAGLIPACQMEPELRFCPNEALSRALAAYMMVQAKELPLH
ncbi:MAG: VCBS repeat-containing protein [Anaerolineales bacterium]|nr:VCBS repeat-containing protein [Anaerolineales bacterium]